MGESVGVIHMVAHCRGVAGHQGVNRSFWLEGSIRGFAFRVGMAVSD
jgi:hypothetical protein